MVGFRALVLAFAAVAMANETPTIGLIVPGEQNSNIYGSIVHVDSKSVTTAVVKCSKGTDNGDAKCSIGDGGATITQGPSTWAFTLTTSSKDFTIKETGTGKIDASKSTFAASISRDVSSSGGSFTTTSTTTISNWATNSNNAVTVTAGADKLSTSTSSTSKSTGAAAPAMTQHAALAGVAAAVVMAL